MEKRSNLSSANACALTGMLVVEILERVLKKRKDNQLLERILELEKDFFFLSNEEFDDLLEEKETKKEEINKRAVFLLSGANSSVSLLEIVDNFLKEDLKELPGEVYALLELSSACCYGLLEVLRGYLNLIEDDKAGTELREKMDELAQKATEITKQ